MTEAGIRRRTKIIIGLLLLLLVAGQTGCGSVSRYLFERPTVSIVDVSFAGRTEGTSVPTSSAAASAAATTTAVVAQTAAPLTAAEFDSRVLNLLLAGLQKQQKEIDLSDAVRSRRIPESDVQATINRIFEIYRDLYSRHAEFFYLDGSINVGYTLLNKQGSFLDSMVVKPQYWSITRDLTASQLTDLINQVNVVVNQVASQVKSQTVLPWQQLQLIHDYLVSHIAYNSDNDQNKNQPISALLEKTTLCQGYAQSYQLIAQRLGFEIRMISGKSEGIGHAWNLVRLDGAWYHVDVTHDDPTPDAGSSRPVEHVHFLRSDAVMQDTHQWEKKEYPASPNDGVQYYIQMKLTVDSRVDLEKRIIQFARNIDYKIPKANLLELLYSGADLPDEAALEKMVKQVLSESTAGHTVYYRQQVTKKIILVEITPE